ncbi:nuclear transport factor 2-like isoform X2 [Tasmannia lanceolata]|uniref:nuclear transport factor 2-like isoform X2 n=1 Tax=Tasmannia lanceolata TaxID=3420 RepID=UPI004062D630
MASQQAVARSPPPAHVVGNAFVHQYYHILHQSPNLVYRFYQESSKLGRPEALGVMSSITTMQAINEKILSLDYGTFIAEIKTVDAQESFNDGVLVLVTGYLTGKDSVKRNFTQSFFLAPQDKGYFVLNDMFRYTEEVEHHKEDQGHVNITSAPLPPDQDPVPVQEHQVFEQTDSLSEEEVPVEEVYNPSDNDDDLVMEEESLVVEAVEETHNDSQMMTDSGSSIQEEAPKKSYASIVTKESAPPLSVPAPAPPNPERQVVPPPAPSSAPEVPVSSSGSNAIESGNVQEAEATGYSIYIRNLPMNAEAVQIEEEFKRFGPIKSGGVQVRSNKHQAFCFGFVEFEVASAIQSAIEASPIMIGGRQVYVEEKRTTSTSRVNNRGRFLPGRGGGGFRHDGGRGRGNYTSARYYSRGDFNNRSDFVNRGASRGGSSSRGGDGGYQRFDDMGNNSGRMNRPNGFAAPKSVAPRVSASA